MRHLAAIFAALALAACPPPSATDGLFFTGSAEESSSGSTTDEGSTGSTGVAPPESTGTIEETGTGAAGSTGGEPPPPLPEVVFIELTPEPIKTAGPIAVEVKTAHADAVTMVVDDAAPVQLEQIAPGQFAGEIPVVTSKNNGNHIAAFTPTRDPEIGKTVKRPFDATLPEGGTEARWEVSGDLDEALGDAITVGPDGTFYEFGTLDPVGNDPRCYLRRRGPSGEYGQADVLAPLLAGQYCRAKKIEIGPTGEFFLLAEVDQGGIKRWWLGGKDSWDSPVEQLLLGELDAVANGLAVGWDGRAAVCGVAQTGYGDRDAFVQVYDGKGMNGLTRTFDFKYTKDDPVHLFDEVVFDCLFVGGTLVFAGELWGYHPNDVLMDRSRHMVFELDKDTDETVWNIASKGPGQFVQSGARAITHDADDGYVTAGYLCEDPCAPQQMYLRQFLAGAEHVDSFMTMDPTSVPTDIAYSPADYVVVTAARKKGGWWTDFWAQAWAPGAEQESWTYARSEEMTTHIAQGVAIGKYGRVHLTGVAQQAGLYRPVIALVHP
jgi:hypothetical protein